MPIGSEFIEVASPQEVEEEPAALREDPMRQWRKLALRRWTETEIRVDDEA